MKDETRQDKYSDKTMLARATPIVTASKSGSVARGLIPSDKIIWQAHATHHVDTTASEKFS